MPQYKAPLRDMRFLLNEVFDYPAHYAKLSNGSEATPDMVDAILEGCAALCEEVLSPLNLSGDQEGCHFNDGEVTTPKGFKEAYRQYMEGGWQGLSHPKEYGGQGLPMSLNLLKAEMMGTANWSFTMYPGLSLGCMNTVMQYGNEEQRRLYLTPLVEAFRSPVVGFVTLWLLLYVLFAKGRLPVRLPGVLVAFLAGTALYYGLGLAGLGAPGFAPRSGELGARPDNAPCHGQLGQ